MAIKATVEADDYTSGFNTERNLNFRSNILEFSTQLEFNFFPYEVGNNDFPFTPYVFLGLSIFSFKPQGKLLTAVNYKNEQYPPGWVDLQPLGTEGQGTKFYSDKKPYSLLSSAIPFGMGIKWNIFKQTSIGLEYGLRKTFTDYLDDVSTTYASTEVLLSEKSALSAAMADKRLSKNQETTDNTGFQRGNSKNTDWFAYVGMTISFRIKTRDERCPAYE